MCKVRKCEAGCCWKRAYLLYILSQLFWAKQICQHFKGAWEGKWVDGYEWLWWVKLHWHWKTKAANTVKKMMCFLVSESLTQTALDIKKKHYCGLNIEWAITIKKIYTKTKWVKGQYDTFTLFICSGCIIWLLKLGKKFSTLTIFLKAREGVKLDVTIT